MVDWKRIIITCAAAAGVLAAVFFHQPLFQGIGTFLKPTAYRGSEPGVSGGFEPASVADAGTRASEDRPSGLEPEAAPTEPMDIEPEIAPTSETEDSIRTLSDASAAEAPELRDSQPAPAVNEPMKLANFLTAMDLRASRFEALKYAMQLWHTPIEDQPYLDGLDDDQSFFRLATKPKGVSINRLETNLDLLKRLNLPAILKFYPTGSEEPGYVTLSRIDGDLYIFESPDGHGTVVSDSEEISLYWSGIAYVPWKNYLSIWGIIPGNAGRDSVITLKLLLHDIGYDNVALNDSYDASTRRAIEDIQAKYGLPVDGFVGPLTKIILYQEKNAFEMPHLTR
jgi:general secretion pathway protein A